MPAVTAVALDSLLDRGGSGGGGGGGGGGDRHRHHHHHRLYDSRQQRDRQGCGTGNGSVAVEVRRTSGFANHFSPALYATPEPTRISGSSPASVSPSPYVVNIKRRDYWPPPPPPPPVPVLSGAEEGEEVGERWKVEVEENGEEKLVEEEGKESALHVNGDCRETRLLGNGGLEKEDAGDDDMDDFFNSRDSVSVMGSSDTENGGGFRCDVPGKAMSVLTNSEFYDATEDFFCDSSTSHASPLRVNNEADFHSLRLNLFEEIEKRKKVEESLVHMQKQWKKMASQFTQLGLSFPPIPDGLDTQNEADAIAQVCQEIVVARFVSETLERGLARAEVEESAETIIKSKNHEISRLHDRLQYYETVNHEMSQRNQEVIELARRKRQRRRKRQKLLWSSIGLSVTLGASLLAYSFMPQASKGEQSPYESNHCAE